MTQDPSPGASRLGPARLLGWVGILLLTTYLVIIGGAWEGIYDSGIRLASVVSAAVALGVWTLIAWHRPAWRPRSVLIPAIIAALGSLTLSTLTSRYPRQSIEYLGYAILLAACHLLLVRIMAQPWLRVRMEALAIGLCGILGMLYVALVVAHWVDWFGAVGRLTVPPLRPEFENLTYGNPSAVLTITLLLWCAAAAALGFSSRRRVALIGGLGATTAFVILVSGSRAGWFGIGIAGVVTAVAWIQRTGLHATYFSLSRLVARAGHARVAVIAVVIIGIGLSLAPAILRRLADGGESLRLGFVVAAGRMFAESPIVGSGPGTWVIQRIRYTYPPETDYYIPYAHNLYAQTLAELGLVGAIAGLVLLLSLAWLVRDAIRGGDPIRRRWGLAAGFGLVYFGAHQLLDFYANMPAALFAAALPIAWLDATATRTPVVRGRGTPATFRTATGLAGAALVVLSVAGLIWTEGPAGAQARAVASANVGDWATADTNAAVAVAADPAWPPYQFTLGLTAAHVGNDARAAAAFRQAAEADDLPEAWLNLAAEEAILGNAGAARDALSRAARLGLQRPALAIAIGELAARLGETDLEMTGFTTAIIQIPDLAADPWWGADPDRAARFPAIVDAAIAGTDPSTGWQIALTAGQPDRARSLVPAASYLPGIGTADDIIAAWTGNEDAYRRVLAACEAHPLDLGAVSWCGRLSNLRDDVAATERYMTWVNTIIGGAYGSAQLVRVSEGEPLGRRAVGGVAGLYGTYTYRRPTPWNPLVPSLVQLTQQ